VVPQRGHQAHETQSHAFWVCGAGSEEAGAVGHVTVVVELGQVNGLLVVVLLVETVQTEAC
jgi:hypothetical protein